MMHRRSLRLLVSAVLWCVATAPRARADDAADRAAWARDVVARGASRATPAPDFGAKRAWLNVSRPLTLRGDLAGKVVVMDFWCYCCINCQHILPDLAYLERRYEGKAFAVVGVHSAKFVNEKDADHVRDAVVRYEIRHPVVVDDDFAIWNLYGARGWPHLVVVSPDGHVLAAMGGEGHRDELDALVTAALEHYAKTPGALDPRALPIALERAARPATELSYPGKLAADEKGDRLFISDSNHHRIVETTLSGAFVRAFGDGEPGLVDGAAAKARFHRPQGLALEGDALYVADTENHAIRRIDRTSGAVTTIAGTGEQGYEREGTFDARTAKLSSPWDLVFVGRDLYVAMAGNHQIWRLGADRSHVAPWAGDGSERKLDGTLLDAAFAQPSGLATDGKSIFVADSESSSIRRIDLASGRVSTLAGANADPTDLFDFGLKDGAADLAKFQHPLGVAVVGRDLYVADTYNHATRIVDSVTGVTTTPYKPRAPGIEGAGDWNFSEPSGFAVTSRRLFVADTNNHRIRVIDPRSGEVGTLALSGVPIPMASARAAGGATSAAWPTLPGTAKSTAGSVVLRTGVAPRLRVRLDLPAGWHLTEGAPSVVRVDGAEKPVTSAVTATETVVTLPVLASSATPLRIRALFYVCEDGGSCRIRSIDVTLPVAFDREGATEATVTDTFAP